MARYSVGRRRALAILTITSLLLVTLDQSDVGAIRKVRTAGSVILSPLKGVARGIARPIENAWHGVFDYGDVKEENRVLRRELDETRGDRAMWDASIRQYLALLSQNRLQWLSQYSVVQAEVLGGPPSEFERSIEINIGEGAGLKIGMPVVTSCLVGKVTRIDRNSSRVMLVTDTRYITPASAIEPADPKALTGVELPSPPVTTSPPSVPSSIDSVGSSDQGTVGEDNGDTADAGDGSPSPGTTVVTSKSPPTTRKRSNQAIETGGLQGMGADALPRFTLVANDSRGAAVQRGAVIVTTGTNDSLAPPGLPIGYIVNRIDTPLESGPVIEVQPCADLEELSYVTIILYDPFG